MDFWMFLVHLGSVRPSLAASHRLGSEFEGNVRARVLRSSGALTRPLPCQAQALSMECMLVSLTGACEAWPR